MDEIKAAEYHKKQKIASPEYAEKLKEAELEAKDLVLKNRVLKTVKGKLFITTVGFTHSGKSALVEQLKRRLGHLIGIDSKELHNIVDSKFSEIYDDNSNFGEGYWLKQVIVREIRNYLIEELCQQGWWIINDSASLSISEREDTFRSPRKYGYKTVLLWLNLPEKTLMERLKSADREEVAKGYKPFWVDLYEKIQKTQV
ncbi:MAG: ATP-binding protein [Patescibacteria group bacterium]|nr:ATP-binding protein [Patescibacteria group bacterium]